METLDMRTGLSTLWIFALFNYAYADLITLMDPAILKQLVAGRLGTMEMSQGFLLGGAVLIETAIVMVPLSRLLAYRANRLANVIAGVVHTAAVLLSLTLGGAMPAPYYLFFGTIEILCTSMIVWYAWRWRPAAGPATAG